MHEAPPVAAKLCRQPLHFAGCHTAAGCCRLLGVSSLVSEITALYVQPVVVNTDFSANGPHFSAKCKIFPLTVKDAEGALFARIQLGWSRTRYPGRPRAFFGEPHVDVT